MLFYRTRFFSCWLFILNISGFSILRPTLLKDNRVEYKPSIWLIFTTIAELFLLLLILALESFFGKKFIAQDFTGRLILDGILYGGIIVSFFHILLSLLGTKGYAQYGKAVENASSNTSQRDVSKFISGFFKFYVPFFFLYLFSFIWDSTFFFIVQDSVYIFNLIALYTGHYYNLLVISQYSMAIFCIKNKLEKINEDLCRLRYQLRRSVWKIGNLSFKNISKALQNKPIKLGAPGKNIYVSSPAEEIKQHRQFYQAIYDLCLKANRTLSAKLILTIAYNFVMSTLFIFFAIQKTIFIFNKGWVTHGFWELSTSFRVAITHILSIYALVYASDLVYQEVSKIIRMIHIMLIETEDGELEAQLHVFLVQIRYQKIIFSPNSFFALNKSLLLKMLGAISSYLIILHQFQVEF